MAFGCGRSECSCAATRARSCATMSRVRARHDDHRRSRRERHAVRECALFSVCSGRSTRSSRRVSRWTPCTWALRRAAIREDADHRSRRRAAGRRVTPQARRSLVAVGLLATSATAPALAWGPVGHRIAGDLAEQTLCPSRANVKSLGGGDPLRPEPGPTRFATSRNGRAFVPWHYMNIADLPPGTGLTERDAAVDKSFIRERAMCWRRSRASARCSPIRRYAR